MQCVYLISFLFINAIFYQITEFPLIKNLHMNLLTFNQKLCFREPVVDT
jgi:hypothetical protein